MPTLKNILIVEDDSVNRRILSKILSPSYNILEAKDGDEALALLREKGDAVSAVLLDIIMPVTDGYEVLRQMRRDPKLGQIPVIVASGQEGDDAEVKALSLGAYDYIVKPYKPEVIRHKVANTIHLRETAAFINSVQNDRLTGVFSKEYFYMCAENIIKNNPDKKYDIICCDIERFKLVNDLYGTATGDVLLKHVAEMIAESVGDSGICGRIGADVFAFMVDHRESYENSPLIKETENVTIEGISLTIILRYGIYCVEDNTPVNIMCDRASLAKESIKGMYDTYFAYYDDGARRKLLDEQFITSCMKQALLDGEFNVFFQPKYNLKTEQLAGAEALVRWMHPERGIMSPAQFIPLFEKNGFITDLDIYIWEECCKKIRNWIDVGHLPIAVSVNVSRVDVYNPNLPDLLIELIKKYKLSPRNLHLEITETAYTENPEQLIDVVARLKSLGFVIEMDDFGTGYSSLNMLSELPIDVLKLDIKFIQSEEKKGHNKSILSFIISLAKWLNLSVIAEGVETKAQVELLQSLNCEYVQGYYFARPLPLADFEELLVKSDVQSIKKDYNQIPNIPSDGGERKTMLVYDSAGEDLEFCSNLFKDKFDVLGAADMEVTLYRVASLNDKIAVLVINFEDITNMEQIEELYYACKSHNIPTIIVSNSLNSLMTEALHMGVSDCILRPYNNEAFSHRTENVISRAKITQFQRENEINAAIIEMKKRAEEDPLTKLLNRIEFESRVEIFFMNNKHPKGIFVMLDIDDFKHVNDAFGHVAGDKILCNIADVLRSIFTETELISRIGGDEYAIFIPFELDKDYLNSKLENLYKELNVDVEHIKISCSAGIALCPMNGADFEALYNCADIALLTSKRNGKNQYRFYESDMELPIIAHIEEKVVSLLDSTSDAMFVSDAYTSEIIYINETACNILGKTKKECLGSRCYQIFWSRCRNCDRCFNIGQCVNEFYEEDTMLLDEVTSVHIKAKLGYWDGRKVKIHYLQNIHKCEGQCSCTPEQK